MTALPLRARRGAVPGWPAAWSSFAGNERSIIFSTNSQISPEDVYLNEKNVVKNLNVIPDFYLPNDFQVLPTMKWRNLDLPLSSLLPSVSKVGKDRPSLHIPP